MNLSWYPAAIPNLDGVQAHDHDAAPHVGQGVNGLDGHQEIPNHFTQPWEKWRFHAN